LLDHNEFGLYSIHQELQGLLDVRQLAVELVPLLGSVGSIERLAAELGHSVRRLASGAGHDAVYVARTCPTAMIFVPCDGGISHNEIENARPEHLAAGADVLLHAMLEAAR